MTWQRQLENAIARARPSCRRCGNAHVTVEYRPDLRTHVPVSHHWVWGGPEDACPVTFGGAAAFEAHEELWAALAPYLGRADYGEVSWARRQLVAA
jgi:hypothetical protein